MGFFPSVLFFEKENKLSLFLKDRDNYLYNM